MIPHPQPNLHIRKTTARKRTMFAVIDGTTPIRMFRTEAEARRFTETGDAS